MRVAASILGLLLCAPAFAATLEQLSIEQMAQQSTLIVRGRVTGCGGEMRGAIIYTRCGVAVTETWKGAPLSKVDFVVPGGTARGLSQTFSGAPKFNPNEQFVLFLWVGRSGIPQIIGLSQGVFDVTFSKTGQATVKREATSERMLNSKGEPVADEPVSLTVAELKARVDKALGGGGK
ncbi:MAG TPA: hypothetical protein VER03_15530 [Bryobacteraceae bacterium]|nr:hypothetical protein [Bryobacteraceae bacterium]